MAPKRQSAVEKHEAKAKAPPKPKRVLKPQTIDTVTARALDDNFKGWPSSLTDGLRVDGLTLRETITRDKRRQREETGFAMGAVYYRDLKSKYQAPDDPAKQLVVADATLPVSPSLVVALQALRGGVPNRTVLTEFLAGDPTLNQKELVGLLRVVLEQKPAVSAAAASLCLDVLKYCARKRFLAAHPAEMQVMRAIFDQTLLQSFLQLKRDRLPTSTFVSVYAQELPYVLDLAAVLKVLQAEDWLAVASELYKVTESSALGHKMFGYALVSVTSEQMGRVMTEKINGEDPHVMTVQRVEMLRQEMREQCLLIPGQKLLLEKRCIKVDYRGTAFEVEVTGLNEEISVRIACEIKGRAVETDLLVPLVCEDALQPHSLFGAPNKVDEQLLKEARLARAAANGMLEQEAWSSGEFVVETLEARSGTLFLLDPVGGKIGRAVPSCPLLCERDNASS
jgi:hypothetical protein